MDEQDRKNSDSELQNAATGAGTGADAPPIADLPPVWGPYQILQVLGQGGMGKVYKAFDPSLKRHVALKLLRSDDPDLCERLKREAQAQAQVDHPCVCRVYEVGEKDGKVYLSLQYIQGKPLNAVYKEMNLEERLKVMLQVSEALHAAHKLGIVHRDVKPANIMVERVDGGGWRPYVMDFGLARQQEATGMTVTGMVMGTPFYMAPEQAAGEIHRIDRRSDVYSIGATLYELLCGSPPFEGESTMEVLLHVLQNEVPPLRKREPSVPVDIETVVMRCLEKDPSRRYGSAREIAEDLSRYFNGEAVLARRSTVFYRMRRKAAKHRGIVTAAGIGLVAAMALAGLWVRSMWQTSRQVEAARVFGEQVREVEALMRYSHLVPLHDTRKERAIVEAKLKRIRKTLEEGGGPSEGPGHYALGQGYLALGDYDSAKRYLDAAWAAGYRGPDVAYALGLTMGKLYERALDRLKGAEGAERERVSREIDAAFRKPAVSYLAAGRGSEMAATDYAAALLASYRKQWETALERTRSAYTQFPWLYEARVLEGRIYVEMAMEKQFSGQSDRAMEFYRNAEESYRSALRVGQSDPEGYQSLCSIWKWMMYLRLYGEGGEIASFMEPMQDACNNALIADPSQATPLTHLAEAFRLQAEYKFHHGQDPVDSLVLSAQMAEKAVAINPKDPEAHHHLGNARGFLGYVRFTRGEEFRSQGDQWLQSMQKATQLAPNDYRIALDLGNAYSLKADYEITAGSDPESSLLSAIRSFRRSAELAPFYTYAYNNLGTNHMRLARYRMSNGQDAEEDLNQAVDAFKKAIHMNSRDLFPCANLSDALNMRAELQISRGVDPAETLRSALETAEQAIRLNPDFYESYLNKAVALRLSSRQQFDADALARSAQAARRSLELNPTSAAAMAVLGDVHCDLAEMEVQRGGDPEKDLQEAYAQFQRSLKQDRTSVETYLSLASARLIEARWKALSGGRPEAPLALCHEAVGQALKLNAGSDAYRLQGEAYLLAQKWESAQASFDEALKRNAADARNHLGAARTAALQSPPRRKEGLDAARKALYLNPKQIEARVIELLLMPESGGLQADARDELDGILQSDRLLAARYRSLYQRTKEAGQ